MHINAPLGNLINIFAPYRDCHNLKNMWLARYYFDGSFSCFGTDSHWDRMMLENGWHSTCVKNLVDPALSKLTTKPTLISWSSEVENPGDVLDAVRIHSQVLSGHNFLIRRGDHIESIGFSSALGINELQQSLLQQNTDHTLFLLTMMDYHNDLPLEKLGDLDIQWNDTLGSKLKRQDKIPLTLFGKTNHLSPRQIEVFLNLARGLCFKDVANLLDISPRTVDFHVNDLRQLWDYNSLPRLIAEVHKCGYFDLLSSLI